MKSFLDNYCGNIFFFPYISNTKGNTRGDVLNFVTMAHAFDKDCVNVPRNEEGKLSFKLERLAKANNFDSSNSHEAIADVEVTMQLMCLLKNKRNDLFRIFLSNSSSRNVEEKIQQNDLFTLHNYLFNNHKIYLVKKLIKHPSYKNQFIGFDMKYEVDEIIKLSESELKDEYKKKSFFRKIKLNKQPSILDKSYALKFKPYSNLSNDEIDRKCRLLDDKNFLKNLENILQKESLEYLDNQSQEVQLEESTIYSQNLNYNDSFLMKDFHNQPWDLKWNFAEKFKDPRLRFFAAKHIFRNFPETLPKKVFLHLHKKVSERIFSLEKKSFLTLPGAMEEADTVSLEIEENSNNKILSTQLNQYNIYIDFLNDYYRQLNPKPIRFDSNLSKKLFG